MPTGQLFGIMKVDVEETDGIEANIFPENRVLKVETEELFFGRVEPKPRQSSNLPC